MGNNYVSLSRVRDCVKTKFDAEGISRVVAGKGKYAGMDQAAVLQSWEDNRDKAARHGTQIHDAIERYTSSMLVNPEDEKYRIMLEAISADYRDYERTYSEEVLYSPVLKERGCFVAGTADRLLLVSKKSNVWDLEDYKTNLNKGIQFAHDKNQYMLEPMGHLQDCNFNDYALQLSIYALWLQELTGAKIRSLWIRFIPADNPLNYRRIPVPFMKYEAEELLTYYNVINGKKLTNNN